MTTRAERKRKARRATLPGYPKEFVFTKPAELVEYFSGDKITCLRCGKSYKSLGVHLKLVHEMEPDEYRGIYGVPWTKGLVADSTKELYAELAKKKIEDGVFVPSADQAELARQACIDHQRPRQPVRNAYTQANLAKMNAGKSGEGARRRKLAAKRGTKEFKEKMRNRPQTKDAGKRLGDYWRGREQTDEHVFNRTGYHKKANP